MMRVGLISDTHGLLRPEAVEALEGCGHIVHAGDVGRPDILTALRKLAPVTAVRGNVDSAIWATDLPMRAMLTLCGCPFYVLHDLKTLNIDPKALGVRVVVSGHTHKPVIERRDGVLYVNPGAAGPRRFTLPVTIALLNVAGDGTPRAEICPLDASSPAARAGQR
jgi:putative phosphoesterase